MSGIMKGLKLNRKEVLSASCILERCLQSQYLTFSTVNATTSPACQPKSSHVLQYHRESRSSSSQIAQSYQNTFTTVRHTNNEIFGNKIQSYSYSTETGKPKTTDVTRVNKNVTVLQQSSDSESIRPIVLLLSWLFAKPAHLKKYTDFYIQQGFDVISVKIELKQLLMPKNVQKIATSVLDLCQEADRKVQPLLVHGFSVGGYVLGEMLASISDFPQKYGDITGRLYGQILDSPIDCIGVPKGIARALSQNVRMSDAIQSSLQWYLDYFQGTTIYYKRASDIYRSNTLKMRSIFLYSMSDPVCDPDEIERLASIWRENGIDAETEFWHKSPHASIFSRYPDEYAKSVQDFIDKTGIKLLKQEIAVSV